MRKFKAIMIYTIDKKHSDFKYLKDKENWTEDREYTFEDTYTFTEDYNVDDVKEYIKKDMMLVCGGGYNTDHIHNVKLEIKRVY